MPSNKLLSEVVAWRNFTLKEETPNRIIFDLWDKTNWEKIAKGNNRDLLLGNLTTIILLLAGSNPPFYRTQTLGNNMFCS